MGKTQSKNKPLQEATAPQEETKVTQEVPIPQESDQPAQEAPQEATDSQEGDQPVQKPPAAQENTVIVDYPEGLNLRDGPGKAFNILETLPNGATLTVLALPEGAEVPGYALVRYTGGKGGQDWPLVGWINTDFVRED